MTKTGKVRESISDRDLDVIRMELMAKTKNIYCELQYNFENLSRQAKRAHLRAMLKEFAEEAGRDCRELELALSRNSRLKIETDDRHLGMFTHLISVEEASLTDEERVILNALKVSDNLRNVFKIMAKEYRDENIRRFFDTLSKHETHRENELEQLYEDIIVQGQW
ncbi:MAG: hypothetical protein ACP5UZ_07925 [Thermoplasmata archaeon]